MRSLPEVLLERRCAVRVSEVLGAWRCDQRGARQTRTAHRILEVSGGSAGGGGVNWAHPGAAWTEFVPHGRALSADTREGPPRGPIRWTTLIAETIRWGKEACYSLAQWLSFLSPHAPAGLAHTIAPRRRGRVPRFYQVATLVPNLPYG